MQQRLKKKIYTLLSALYLFVSPLWAKEPLKVLVSIPPQAYFVEQLAGKAVQVKAVISAGATPEAYDLRPSMAAFIKQADMYFSIGVPFEAVWLDRFRAINPRLTIIPTTSLKAEARHHDHGNSEQDPHSWLSPLKVKQQLFIVYRHLVTALPEKKKVLKKHHTSFNQRIDRLHHHIDMLLQPVKHRSFLVFHPSWGHFAKAYNLHQVAVEKEGKEPSVSDMLSLIKWGKANKIKTIFSQPEFSQQALQSLATTLKARIVFIAPLAYDWERNLLDVAEKIARGLNE